MVEQRYITDDDQGGMREVGYDARTNTGSGTFLGNSLKYGLVPVALGTMVGFGIAELPFVEEGTSQYWAGVGIGATAGGFSGFMWGLRDANKNAEDKSLLEDRILDTTKQKE